MSVVTRKFSACPVRTAALTWETIVSILSGSKIEVNQQLASISGIASSIISDETPKADPITIIGSGPRLRIYCLYDEDGSEEDANEGSLNWDLFKDDWEIFFPVAKEDLDWITKALKQKGAKFKAYEAGTDINESVSELDTPVLLSINVDKLKSYG